MVERERDGKKWQYRIELILLSVEEVGGNNGTYSNDSLKQRGGRLRIAGE